MYGMAEIVQRDASGIILSQVIHNQVVNEGEELILHAVFDTDTNPLGSADRVSTLCLTTLQETRWDEDSSNSTFHSGLNFFVSPVDDPEFRVTNDPCRNDLSVEIADGTAIIGPLDFVFEETNFRKGEINDVLTGGVGMVDYIPIRTIAVCSREDSTNNANALEEISCANAGSVFAAVDVGIVQYRDGDTLTVSYTFDISSPTS